jgi:hypothetical protein
MLSAQKQETPLGSSSTQSDSRSPGGFGKVISSLQGLQQRLEDFSIDDLIKAETNAQTLILRLTEFQDKLARLAELKNSMVSATELVAQVPTPDFELVNVDSLARHPQLHALVKAGKLIKFLKLVKATRASVEFNAVAADDDVRLPKSPSTVSPLSPMLGQPSLTTRSSLEEPKTSAAEEKIIPPEIEPVEKDLSTTAPQLDDFSHESLRSSVERAADDAVHIDSTPVAEIGDLPPLVESVDEALPMAPLEPENQTPSDEFSPSLASSINTIPDIPVAEATEDLHLIDEPESSESGEPDDVYSVMADIPQEPASSTSERTKTSAGSAGSFDQRLLDDVIKNYGEFSTLAGIPAAAELPKQAKPEFEDTRIATPSAVITDNRVSEAKSDTSAEQPAVQGRDDFTFEIDSADAADGRLPSVRRAGELDRELKKIIKDYGEYDLYSNQSTVNLKTAGIAAFAVLGLVFGGIYFFRTPNSAPTPPAASVSKTPATTTDQAPQESKEEPSNSGEKTDTPGGSTNAAKKLQYKNP